MEKLPSVTCKHCSRAQQHIVGRRLSVSLDNPSIRPSPILKLVFFPFGFLSRQFRDIASKKLTISPVLNRDGALGAFTTLPARSRPLIQGKAGKPKPKSLLIKSALLMKRIRINKK